MKTLLAAIAILLSANLAAQDDQFKIKGFYAGMPLEEFEAVAESHGGLLKEELWGFQYFYFLCGGRGGVAHNSFISLTRPISCHSGQCKPSSC